MGVKRCALPILASLWEREAPAARVIDVPQAGHDIGHPCREERPAEAQGALDPRHRSGARTTGGEDHRARAGEIQAPQLMKGESAGIAGPRVRGEETTR